jgi:hypothetical protein
MIQVISGRSGNGEATYSKHYAYFLKIRDRFEDIHTKRQFLTVFSQHRAELKKYFRRQHIRINDRHPENMINLIRFYNTLIEAGYTPSGSVKN